jgi:hypothetical protein
MILSISFFISYLKLKNRRTQTFLSSGDGCKWLLICNLHPLHKSLNINLYGVSWVNAYYNGPKNAPKESISTLFLALTSPLK